MQHRTNMSKGGAAIWLRALQADESTSAKLAGLPARERYEWLPPNELRRAGQQIPTGRLPNLTWQSLSEWLKVESPIAALPGQLSPRSANAGATLRLTRSHIEIEPDLLLTSLEEFSKFAANAAQIRLEPLRFAANAEGEVLILGQPLPPLPGQRFVLHSGIAVPAGFTWQPAVSADVLARKLGVSGDSIVMWAAGWQSEQSFPLTPALSPAAAGERENRRQDKSEIPFEGGRTTRLHAEQFVPVSRSALRATEAALANSRSS